MGDPVRPAMLQNPNEFQQLLDLYTRQQPMRTLEIGAGEGGTLWHWLNNAPTAARVVAVDDNHVNQASYPGWTPANVELVTITGNSQHADTIKHAARFAPYDFVFIDADHHDHAVRADWQNYECMAAPGATIALHDITPTDDPTIEVDQLWSELRLQHDTDEITVQYGIGIVHIPQTAGR